MNAGACWTSPRALFKARRKGCIVAASNEALPRNIYLCVATAAQNINTKTIGTTVGGVNRDMIRPRVDIANSSI
jgi:hypothetical protein